MAQSGTIGGARGAPAARKERWYRPLWRDLPLWVVPGMILFVAYVELTVFDHPRYDLLPTALASFAWYVAAVRAGLRRAGARKHGARRHILWGALVAAALTSLCALPPAVTDPRTVKIFFEISMVVLAVAMAAHCLNRRGAPDLLSLFGVGLLYGIVLENSGIRMGFFDEPGYLWYVPGLPAPIATMGGWSLCAYLAIWFADRIAPRAKWTARTLIATAFIVSVDLHGDAAASAFGWWIWPEPFSRRLFDIPLINFIAWTSAVLPYYGAYFLVRDREEGAAPGAARRRPLRLLAAMPAVFVLSTVMVQGLTALLLGWGSPEMALFREAVRAVFTGGAGT